MTSYRPEPPLARIFDALEKDLLRDGGPQISVTRNYNFALVPYPPEYEFPLRRHVSSLCDKLRDRGWVTATIALNTLFLNRLRALGEDDLQALIAREKRLARRDPKRALDHVGEKVVQLIEGPEGLAADVAHEVKKLLEAHPDDREHMVVFIARAGSLYPFFRTSALLKHVADHTENVPVVLLYPGTVVGKTGLRFMGKMPADRDYRTRIYC